MTPDDLKQQAIDLLEHLLEEVKSPVVEHAGHGTWMADEKDQGRWAYNIRFCRPGSMLTIAWRFESAPQEIRSSDRKRDSQRQGF